MIPFWSYKQTYVTKKSIPALEKKFSEIEKNPSKLYNEINVKLLSAADKKYRVFVPVKSWSAFNMPFTFSTTIMIAQLFAYGEKTKIRITIRPNFIYLLVFILASTGIAVNFFRNKEGKTLQGIATWIVCMLAAVIIDRISKKILQGTFEHFLK